jgi:hypothetical protein
MSIPDGGSRETRPILLICGCQKYKPFLVAAMTRMRREKSWRIVGCVGGVSEAKYANDLLELPVNDNYETLPTKVHAALTWVRRAFPNSPGIWKTDDDIVYRNLLDLHTAIQKHGSKEFWGLFVHTCPAGTVNPIRVTTRCEDTTLQPTHPAATYCYGHGYWLSASALDLVVDAEAEYASAFLEDVCTGSVLNRQGILPIRVPIPYAEVPRCPELLANRIRLQ